MSSAALPHSHGTLFFGGGCWHIPGSEPGIASEAFGPGASREQYCHSNGAVFNPASAYKNVQLCQERDTKSLNNTRVAGFFFFLLPTIKL